MKTMIMLYVAQEGNQEYACRWCYDRAAFGLETCLNPECITAWGAVCYLDIWDGEPWES